ncbi:hypothetical protein GCM10023176_14030 [Micromonospora coerulea]|uniref:Uncharacterized protein n=1 Tax=Micromonospora coerulea TaxID=47856 RepID=A0ABP8SD33_9ACTN
MVGGAARGTRWFDDRWVGGGLRPVLEYEGQGVGFARWYRLHLAECFAIGRRRRQRERWSVGGLAVSRGSTSSGSSAPQSAQM